MYFDHATSITGTSLHVPEVRVLKQGRDLEYQCVPLPPIIPLPKVYSAPFLPQLHVLTYWCWWSASVHWHTDLATCIGQSKPMACHLFLQLLRASWQHNVLIGLGKKVLSHKYRLSNCTVTLTSKVKFLENLVETELVDTDLLSLWGNGFRFRGPSSPYTLNLMNLECCWPNNKASEFRNGKEVAFPIFLLHVSAYSLSLSQPQNTPGSRYVCPAILHESVHMYI